MRSLSHLFAAHWRLISDWPAEHSTVRLIWNLIKFSFIFCFLSNLKFDFFSFNSSELEKKSLFGRIFRGSLRPDWKQQQGKSWDRLLLMFSVIFWLYSTVLYTVVFPQSFPEYSPIKRHQTTTLPRPHITLTCQPVFELVTLSPPNKPSSPQRNPGDAEKGLFVNTFTFRLFRLRSKIGKNSLRKGKCVTWPVCWTFWLQTPF